MENTEVATEGRTARTRAREDGLARTVLLADDDDDFRSALAELLTADGYRVIDVASGEAALAWLHDAKARERSPGVLVLDLMMPRMSGIEVLQRLRKSARWAELPVLVITGANDPMLRVRLDLPIAFKPEVDVVLEAVRRLLPSRSPIGDV